MYKRNVIIYDSISLHYEAHKFNNVAPSAIVTGSPGTGKVAHCFISLLLTRHHSDKGKSVWIIYAARRRLAEKKPFIWYFNGDCYLFVEEGVFEVPPDYQKAVFPEFVWTLIDSDHAEDGIPSFLVAPGTRLFAVFCTSPCKARWSRLHKTTNEIMVIMNPWTRKEIHRAASAFPSTMINGQKINDIFDRLGPIPRLCFDLSFGPDRLDFYERSVQAAITTTSITELEKLFNDPTNSTINATCHNISLISREKRENVRSAIVVAPITRFIQSALTNRFRVMLRAEQLRLYTHFASVPSSRKVAGMFFEARAQQDFQQKILLEIIPMVKLPGTKPQWHSSHVHIDNESLEVSRQDALCKGETIEFEPTRTVDFPSGGPDSILPDHFYIPHATNQAALDSFTLHNNTLYIFQFTVASSHGIKDGLFKFFRRLTNLEIRDWRFIFVIPPNLTLKSPQLSFPEGSKLTLYSAVYDPALR